MLAKPLLRGLSIKAGPAFGHIGKTFILEDGEELIDISAVVCFSKFGLGDVDLVNIVHSRRPSAWGFASEPKRQRFGRTVRFFFGYQENWRSPGRNRTAWARASFPPSDAADASRS